MSFVEETKEPIPQSLSRKEETAKGILCSISLVSLMNCFTLCSFLIKKRIGCLRHKHKGPNHRKNQTWLVSF